MDEYHKLAIDLCTKLDQRLTEETTHLDQVFTDTSEAHEARMDDIAAKLGATDEHFSELCSSVQKTDVLEDAVAANPQALQCGEREARGALLGGE